MTICNWKSIAVFAFEIVMYMVFICEKGSFCVNNCSPVVENDDVVFCCKFKRMYMKFHNVIDFNSLQLELNLLFIGYLFPDFVFQL